MDGDRKRRTLWLVAGQDPLEERLRRYAVPPAPRHVKARGLRRLQAVLQRRADR